MTVHLAKVGMMAFAFGNTSFTSDINSNGLIVNETMAAGFLPEVWVADDDTLNLRRLVSERAALVRSVRRVKSRVQAVLHANLVPKYSGHLFGKGGRDWLSTAPLPKAERDLLARHLDELDWLNGKLEKLDGAMVLSGVE